MTRKRTKQGAASMYIVVFTTMLLMIIAISFVRIILAESARTTNESLSSSAYGSALAGVEDGKTLILKYQKCLDSYGTSAKARAAGNSECEKILYYFETGNFLDESVGDSRCDAIQVLLYGQTSPDEMKISSGSGNNGESLEQAYTCVNINSGSDYIGSLESGRSYRSIPIRMAPGEVKRLKYITIEWYTKDNATNAENDSNIADMHLYDVGLPTGTAVSDLDNISYVGNLTETHKFVSGKSSADDAGGVPTPPAIKVDYFQTGEVFKLSDYYASYTKLNGLYSEGTNTNRSTMTFYPSENTNAAGGYTVDDAGNNVEQYVTKSEVAFVASKAAANPPFPAYCDKNVTSGYICRTKFEVPDVIPSNGSTDRNENTIILRVSSIYGLPEQIDFRVSLETNDGKKDFRNVQFVIDSTGRANDLYRRVEARVDTADVYFPEPQYELQIGATGGDSNLSKKIKITDDCYVTKDGKEERNSDGTKKCSDGQGSAHTN